MTARPRRWRRDWSRVAGLLLWRRPDLAGVSPSAEQVAEAVRWNA